MTLFRVADLDALTTYKLLTGVLVPRPIAWVTSRAPNGKINLAPFSAFTLVSAVPPMVGISIAKHKDTPANIAKHGEFVVNIANVSMVEPLHLSSIEHPPHISEVEELGLELAESSEVSIPRLAMAPAAMECRYVSATPYGDLGQLFVVGEVVAYQVRDDLVKNAKIRTIDLNPLARTAGPTYGGLGDEIVMEQLNALPGEKTYGAA
jgi:flavin reductase (DIM6/NTAB) family NADH-FMN oxidoreductase RutF